MTEMNRRDYLKRMGLATAVAMGGNHLASLHAIAGTSSGHNAHRNHDSSNSNGAFAIQATTGHWPPTGNKPNPAVFGVKLIFVGMVIFGYKGKQARLAFHRGHTDTHKMKIIVSEKRGSSCSDIYTIGDGSQPANIRRIEVGINGQSSDVNFFLGSDFDRAADKGDELDFRWLIDLEGPDGYTRELPKTDQKFTTKLKVKHGTFYTYQRTNSTFAAEGGPFPGRQFGHVVKVMAANIRPLNAGESVYLKINGNDVLPYPLTNQAQYEIYFFNERETGDDNDFDMVFDAVEMNSGEKFKLVRVTRGAEERTTDLCHNLPLVQRATDEAPCMGASFSSGKGL